MGALELRRAGLEDVPLLVRERVDFLKEIRGPLDEDRERALAASLAAYFSETVASGEFAAWLAFEGGRCAATSGIMFYRVPPSPRNLSGRVGYIMNMFTRREFRRRGIGRELFGRLLEEAKARGCGRVSLHATKDGEPLYRAFGFREPPDDPELMLFLP